MMGNILVTVYCLAYNHEEYIEDALKGFVSQKTNFEYVVYVHDDCSTDNTKAIIQKYAEQYPHIIKPIYQKENQYSKGVKIFSTFILPKVDSKYIAVCEGDDYWCNENKLQKQIDFLESHPEYSACVHNTKCLNCQTGEETLINDLDHDADLETEKILEKGNGQYQISSLIYKTELKRSMPDLFKAKGFGDYSFAIYLSLNGKIHYFADVMSVYRKFTANSWTTKMYTKKDAATRKKLEAHHREIVKLMNNVDTYTNGKYHDITENAINEHEFFLLYNFNDYKALWKNRKRLDVKPIIILKAFVKSIIRK